MKDSVEVVLLSFPFLSDVLDFVALICNTGRANVLFLYLLLF